MECPPYSGHIPVSVGSINKPYNVGTTYILDSMQQNALLSKGHVFRDFSSSPVLFHKDKSIHTKVLVVNIL